MRLKVLGVGFDNLTKDEAVTKALSLMQERKGAYIVTPNPEIVMRARSDEDFRNAVAGADLVIADGVGIIFGAKILGRPLRERIPGIELTQAIFEKMAKTGGSVYLFGAKPQVADKAADKLTEQFEGLKVVGTSDGYFDDDTEIIQKINAAAPDLLLVCLGAPKQELWMQKNAGSLNAALMIGAGGSLDVFSGEVERAPEAFRKLGLEWLHRLLKNPSRIGRMMQLPKFLICVISEKITKKH